MNLDRNPFVASACEDVADGRTRTVSVAQLASGAAIDDLDADEEHVVTDTFRALWDNLPTSSPPSRGLLLAVMRGIRIEQRHPAYRVSSTAYLHVYQSQVGDNVTLVFRAFEGDIVWLAVLHRH